MVGCIHMMDYIQQFHSHLAIIAKISSKLTQQRSNVNKFGSVVDSIVATGLVVIFKLPL